MHTRRTSLGASGLPLVVDADRVDGEKGEIAKEGRGGSLRLKRT
jgi:hypothetical protein